MECSYPTLVLSCAYLLIIVTGRHFERCSFVQSVILDFSWARIDIPRHRHQFKFYSYCLLQNHDKLGGPKSRSVPGFDMDSVIHSRWFCGLGDSHAYEKKYRFAWLVVHVNLERPQR